MLASKSQGKKIGRRRQLPRYITEAECDLMVARAPSDREKLLLVLLWQTGGRVSEVCGIRRRDINLAEGTITMRNLKQRVYAEKIVGIGAGLASQIERYCESQGITGDGWLFPSRKAKGSPVSRKTAHRLVTGLARSLGILKPHADGKSVPLWPHCFRHGCAVNLLNKTGNIEVVREQLGHGDLSTTAGYLELVPKERLGKLREVLK